MNNPRQIVYLLALACAAVGGGIGYIFGWYVFPQIMNSSNEVSGQSGAAFMFCWILAILGGIGGAQWGKNWQKQKRRAASKQARLDKYAAHLEQFEREKQEADAREAERARARAALYGDDDTEGEPRRRASRR